MINDLADRSHQCDLLLDQTYGRQVQEYQLLVPEQAKVLCGSSTLYYVQDLQHTVNTA